jgi:hypothetical protein
MELGAIGEKARRSRKLGKLRTTVAGDRGGVIFWRFRRFVIPESGKHQESLSFPQFVGYDIEPWPFRDQSVM